jgi:hypothetical protein
LFGSALGFDLTLFPVDHYYTASWGKMLDVSGSLPSPKWGDLPCTFPHDCVIAHLMSLISNQAEPLYAVIATDYFGGMGDQWAAVYRGAHLASDTIIRISPALRYLGVVCRDTLDEFDTAGLDEHRRMPEYLDKYQDMADELGV